MKSNNKENINKPTLDRKIASFSNRDTFFELSGILGIYV